MFRRKTSPKNFKVVLCVSSLIIQDKIIESINSNPNKSKKPIVILEKFSFGRACIQYLRSHPEVNLVIVDDKLEGLDGYETTRKIRELRPDIQILLIASENESKLRKAQELYAIDEILMHPWQQAYIWSRFDRLLEKE